MKKLILLFLMMMCLISVSASAKDFKATLTWDANTEPDLAGYRIYKSETSGLEYQKIGEVGLVTTYEDDFSVPDGQIKTFYYVVTAFDQTNLESDYSNEVSEIFNGNVPPASPHNLQITIKVAVKIDIKSDGSMVATVLKPSQKVVN